MEKIESRRKKWKPLYGVTGTELMQMVDEGEMHELHTTIEGTLTITGIMGKQIIEADMGGNEDETN